jgi:hypothetical protein
MTWNNIDESGSTELEATEARAKLNDVGIRFVVSSAKFFVLRRRESSFVSSAPYMFI